MNYQNVAAMLRSIADKLDDGKAMPTSIRNNCDFGYDGVLAAKFEIDIAYVGDKRNSDYAEALAALDAKPKSNNAKGSVHKGKHAGLNILVIMGKTFYIPRFAQCVAVDRDGEVWAYSCGTQLIKPKDNAWVVSEYVRSNDLQYEKIGSIGKVISSWRDEIYPVNQ